MHLLKTLVIFLLNIFLFVSIARGQDQDIPDASSFLANHGLKTGQEAPGFQYETIDGREIDLQELQGEYVLIDFWGTWCKPCLEEAPFLKEAYDVYQDEVTFIGVAVDDREQKVREFNQRFGINWPQIMVASDSELVKKFNVKLFPTTFLIGPDQTVIIGANSEEQIDSLKGENLLDTLNEYLN